MQAGLTALMLGAVLTLSGPAKALSPFEIVRDPWRGLAIHGYDPIAYLTDQTAREGDDAHLLVWQDIVWRFANEGNLIIFRADPEFYAPAYGGHDPVAAARGYAAEGDPRLFVVRNERVYLFYSPANRHVFLLDPMQFIEGAERNWPDIAARLPF
ncbi:MAG: hypothetical protein KDI98_08020 [Hyphomicrobiaceae bacterium]|nr:hypothetical protein [Hyphomicrobiaceae bacterium]